MSGGGVFQRCIDLQHLFCQIQGRFGRGGERLLNGLEVGEQGLGRLIGRLFGQLEDILGPARRSLVRVGDDLLPAEEPKPAEPAFVESSPLDAERGLADEASILERALAQATVAPVEQDPEPAVTHVSAEPLGRQKIDVPVQLQIGEHSIRFHLTISLDIPQLVRPGGNGHGTGSARR